MILRKLKIFFYCVFVFFSQQNLLEPSYRLNDITELNESHLEGVDVILFDKDKTLVLSKRTNEVPEKVFAKISELKNNFSGELFIFSNDQKLRDETFRKTLEKDIGIEILDFFDKPFGREFLMERFPDKKILIIGDNRYLDVLQGNLIGAKTVLVKWLKN